MTTHGSTEPHVATVAVRAVTHDTSEQSAAARRYRAARTRVGLAIMLLVFGAATATLRSLFPGDFFYNFSTRQQALGWLWLVSFALFTLGFAILASEYLAGRIIVPFSATRAKRPEPSVRAPPSASVTRETSSNTNATTDEMARISVHRSPRGVRNYSAARRTLLGSSRRLRAEISALALRGNLSLVIGVVTTCAALGTIYWAATSVSENNVEVFLFRASIAVFIEVFSFFFLRLYRAGLHDIKYFQNELTNIDSKTTAVELALDSGDPKLLRHVATLLGGTERNFILKKGETTTDLEVTKLHQREIRDLATLISAITQPGRKTRREHRTRPE